MATFIQTDELTGTTIPSTAGTLIRKDQWGIDATLSGYIIQDVTINTSRMTDPTQDQKGAVVSELDYDCRWDMTMTVIGGDGTEDPDTLPGIATGDTTFTWAGAKWKVQGVQYTGNFQSKKQYQITAYRYKNFPAQS